MKLVLVKLQVYINGCLGKMVLQKFPCTESNFEIPGGGGVGGEGKAQNTQNKHYRNYPLSSFLLQAFKVQFKVQRQMFHPNAVHPIETDRTFVSFFFQLCL